MGTLIQVGQLLLSLSILVFVHEMGHFLAARMFGIRVKKFYLFFDFLFPMPNVLNFALFKFKKGDTEYGLGWFPLGGYVQIGGMVDESMDEEEMNAPVRDDDYRAKPVWQRFIVMIGGIVMNVLFGVLFYILFLGFFKKEYVPVSEFNKYGLYCNPLADTIGFKNGDKIVSIDGTTAERADEDFLAKIRFANQVTVERAGTTINIPIDGKYQNRLLEEPFIGYMKNKVLIKEVIKGEIADKAGLQINDTFVLADSIKILNFEHFKNILYTNKQKPINFIVKRDRTYVNISVTPDSSGKIGIKFKPLPFEYYNTKKYTTIEAITYGFKDAMAVIPMQLKGFAKIFKGHLSARKGLSSPIGMTDAFEKSWDWSSFFGLTAIISMALAFGNILPIPALDGGHMILLLIEGITGKPLNQKLQERIQTIGMIILLALMAFTFGNDILKKFGI